MSREALPIYLDHAATTPVACDVADLMIRLMTVDFGNAGSRTHGYGAAAARELGRARERVAFVAACEPREVIFTSGATEAANLAILGLAASTAAVGRRHIVTTQIEHKAVLEPIWHLEADGFEVSFVQPGRDGSIDAGDVLAAVRTDTLLVSVMHANNETGAILPIGEIADGLADDGPALHVDAAQTFGKLDGGYRHPRVDLASASAHKLFAPGGVGCLVMRSSRRAVQLQPLVLGGGQERGIRAGTVSVPLVAAFGLAAENAWRDRSSRSSVCSDIRAASLKAFAPLDPSVHGGRDVLPHILSISFPGIDSEAVMVILKDLVAVSNGSACTSASYGASHVLEAMRLPEEEIEGTVRFSWSHHDDRVPWDLVAARLSTVVT